LTPFLYILQVTWRVDDWLLSFPPGYAAWNSEEIPA